MAKEIFFISLRPTKGEGPELVAANQIVGMTAITEGKEATSGTVIRTTDGKLMAVHDQIKDIFEKGKKYGVLFQCD